MGFTTHSRRKVVGEETSCGRQVVQRIDEILHGRLDVVA
jgi:hypothetical protein